MNPSLVGVVVLTWNNEKDIRECLQSLLEQTHRDYKLVVVDNNSSDNTVSIVMQEFPQVELIPLKKNLYFAGGNNYGIAYLQEQFSPDFIAILNPDTILEPTWMESQLKVMTSDPEIGILGPKVIFAEGYGIENKVSTSGRKIINTAGILPGGFLFPYDRGYGDLDIGLYNTQQEVYAVSGVSMLCRTEVLSQIGGFFAPMQMYLEDVDLCLRAKKAGWKVVYTPATVVEHKHMQSTKQFGKGKYVLWSRRNYLLLVKRNYSFRKLMRAIGEVAKEATLLQFTEIMLSFFKVSLFG